ncbi:hypothetical protein J6590_014004 [Homalodisca vitripennis]|nr:hypothetical protein J6590_014004 [Homalodisca vitripennis]
MLDGTRASPPTTPSLFQHDLLPALGVNAPDPVIVIEHILAEDLNPMSPSPKHVENVRKWTEWANFQNELVKLLSEKVKSKNIADIKAAEEFSVMLDCTSGRSHKSEHLSLVIRFLKIDMNARFLESENKGVSAEELLDS